MSTTIKAEYAQGAQLKELINQGNLVVVDYTATWCGPCRLIAPLMDQLADEYQGKAQVVKVDLDQNKDNAKQYNIRSIPTVLIFKNGQEVDRVVGRANYEQFSNALEKQLRL
ncbi:thioredoxin [Xenococcus sp. PCC 7305]|uniref:thioredoxin n=1 Tax=Xenococcus sp. PCC 7305 TaxID=102125 RepID=UPI0002ACA0C3|nr:thioredoxin [Xenococcus sp. PCC 7305]ELS02901.1 thioredoxin [Xenococcus sp. PCC 7305]